MSIRTVRTPAEWRLLLAEYHASGEPAGLFCRRHNIHTTTLHYWLRKEKPYGKPLPRLLPVVEPNALPQDSVEIFLPKGITLRFSPGASAGYVASIIKGIGQNMLLPASVRVFMSDRPVDMRKGFNCLIAIVRTVWHQDVFSGHLFVFLGLQRDRAKILLVVPRNC